MAHAASQILEDIVDCDARMPNARLTTANLWVDLDAVEKVHALNVSRTVPANQGIALFGALGSKRWGQVFNFDLSGVGMQKDEVFNFDLSGVGMGSAAWGQVLFHAFSLKFMKQDPAPNNFLNSRKLASASRCPGAARRRSCRDRSMAGLRRRIEADLARKGRIWRIRALVGRQWWTNGRLARLWILLEFGGKGVYTSLTRSAEPNRRLTDMQETD